MQSVPTCTRRVRGSQSVPTCTRRVRDSQGSIKERYLCNLSSRGQSLRHGHTVNISLFTHPTCNVRKVGMLDVCEIQYLIVVIGTRFNQLCFIPLTQLEQLDL